jgi:polyferredoxin
MAALQGRLKVLRSLVEQPHRYERLRRLTMAATVVVLYAAPIARLICFDLWDGRYTFLRARVNVLQGLVGLMLSIVVFYIITFVLNMALGRVFCGWGCPVGEMSRVGDEANVARKTKKNRLRAETRAIGWALALAGAALLWFCDPHVFTEGTWRARGIALGGLAGTTGVFYLFGVAWGFRFCETYCPIGLYYTAIQVSHRFGIHFDKAKDTCIDCDLCTEVCPVQLHPRELGKMKDATGGLSVDDFPERNHCLVCGDCVRTCENVFRKKGLDLVPLRLSREVPAAEPEVIAPAKTAETTVPKSDDVVKEEPAKAAPSARPSKPAKATSKHPEAASETA